jgi:hypothetical protein
MSAKVVIFDNGYRYYLDSEYIADENGVLVAGLYDLIRELPLNPKELSDVQLWVLCKPIIMAHQLGIEQTEKRMTKKILKIFELKEGDE